MAEAVAETLRERGCDVSSPAIGFTDRRWAERFSRLPLRHAIRDILGMLPPQLRGATGEITIPEAAREGDYDLVCIGSPTWFFRPSVPIRSWLESAEAGRLLGGHALRGLRRLPAVLEHQLQVGREARDDSAGRPVVANTHFVFEGGQIRSLAIADQLLREGREPRRYLGLKIPPSLLQPDFAEQAGRSRTSWRMASTSPGRSA